jgi:hypothetical protein
VSARDNGPWDVTEVEGPDGRLDFGSLWIRGLDGLQVQAQVDEATGSVGLITLGFGQGAVQVQVFAAPRSSGLWDEVRGKLKSSVNAQGGVIEEATGDLGVELRGRVPQQGALQPVRFVGVDGQRWFLRGLFLGAAAEPGGSPELERVFRDIVVVRGSDAMPAGEALALRLPTQEGSPTPEAEPGQPASASE